MTSTKKNTRLHHFDLLRLFLVLLALLSHFFLSQQLGRPIVFTAVVRTATPALLIIFGFMIEHVYARRWKANGPRLVLQRMLTRAVLCSLAFAAIMVVVFFKGEVSAKHLLGSFMMVVPGHTHADLFKYYALLIPIAFLLMCVRFKYGWGAKYALVILLVGGAELARHTIMSFHQPLQHMGSLFLGVGDDLGPSVIHSVTLILFGQVVASHISAKGVSLQRRVLISLGVASFGAVIVEAGHIGIIPFLANMARYSGYRAHNSYVYFAYGIAAFIVYWALSWTLAKCLQQRAKDLVSYYGGNTFTIFFYGNIVILLTPAIPHSVMLLALTWAVTIALSLASVRTLEWLDRRFIFILVFNKGVYQVVNFMLNSAVAVLSLNRKKQPLKQVCLQEAIQEEISAEKELMKA